MTPCFFLTPQGDMEECAVRDANLVTGQNPASSQRVASLVVELLTAPGGTLPDALASPSGAS